MDSYLLEAVKAAPLMVVAFGGVYLISRLFLTSWQRSEEERGRVMDERHKVYFEQLRLSNEAMCQAIDRGTEAIKEASEVQRHTNEVLGSVKELMRQHPNR